MTNYQMIKSYQKLTPPSYIKLILILWTYNSPTVIQFDQKLIKYQQRQLNIKTIKTSVFFKFDIFLDNQKSIVITLFLTKTHCLQLYFLHYILTKNFYNIKICIFLVKDL
ncbi:hypothetical protein EDEG_03896 [Edhazardia aedis USNM 41457]|uniref:Uncharacterized protein n=1 Tax=Edhazardia aedis (strain USNM 41457) TaxID=1003232 RepID=J9DJI0_EDHAE|nr:hypothetical protein EDEG_03896 [Edhazardia aedis USNM 41457]|eukprot:EJW01527.1 hypothetical protein EDEG_03896 [Edhazardia aedis USNM 41457]